MQSNASMLVELIINGFIAVGIALVPILALIIFNKTYRRNIKKLFTKLITSIKKLETENISSVYNKTEQKSEVEDNSNNGEFKQ